MAEGHGTTDKRTGRAITAARTKRRATKRMGDEVRAAPWVAAWTALERGQIRTWARAWR